MIEQYKLDKLEEYAYLEGSELGDYWFYVIEIYRVVTGSIPDNEEFVAATEKEINRIYQDLCDNWKIREETWEEQIHKNGKLIKTITRTDKTLVSIYDYELWNE